MKKNIGKKGSNTNRSLNIPLIFSILFLFLLTAGVFYFIGNKQSTKSSISNQNLPKSSTLTVIPQSSQPEPTPIVIWQSYDQNVEMKVGQTIKLTFNRGVQDTYEDFVTSSDNNKTLNLESTNVNSEGIWTAVYKATQSGDGIITTTGTPICLKSNPPCNYPISTFKIIVSVN